MWSLLLISTMTGHLTGVRNASRSVRFGRKPRGLHAAGILSRPGPGLERLDPACCRGARDAVWGAHAPRRTAAGTWSFLPGREPEGVQPQRRCWTQQNTRQTKPATPWPVFSTEGSGPLPTQGTRSTAARVHSGQEARASCCMLSAVRGLTALSVGSPAPRAWPAAQRPRGACRFRIGALQFAEVAWVLILRSRD